MPSNVQTPETLLTLVEAAQASYLVYRNSHWRARGPNYYGNHLLLQRLYEDTEKMVDDLSERVVGHYGSGWMTEEHSHRIASFVDEFTVDDAMHSAVNAASRVHELIATAFADLEAKGQLTLGLDDLLAATQSKVEEHLYLLGQATSGEPLQTKKSRLKNRLMR